MSRRRVDILRHLQIKSQIKLLYIIYINTYIYIEIFQNPSILAFHRNKNLRDIVGTKLTENGEVKRKYTNKINIHHD